MRRRQPLPSESPASRSAETRDVAAPPAGGQEREASPSASRPEGGRLLLRTRRKWRRKAAAEGARAPRGGKDSEVTLLSVLHTGVPNLVLGRAACDQRAGPRTVTTTKVSNEKYWELVFEDCFPLLRKKLAKTAK